MSFTLLLLNAEQYAQERAAFVSIDDVRPTEVPDGYKKRHTHSDDSAFYRKEFENDDGQTGVVQLCTLPF